MSRWVLVCLASFPDSISTSSPRAGLSVSESANLGGFSCATVSRAYRQWCVKQKHWQLCVNWKTTTRYDSVINNIVSECTARAADHIRFSLFHRQHWAEAYKSWTDCKNAAFSEKFQFVRWHTDGAGKLFHVQHEFMDSSCLVSVIFGCCYLIGVAHHQQSTHLLSIYDHTSNLPKQGSIWHSQN